MTKINKWLLLINKGFARLFPFSIKVYGNYIYYNSFDRFLAVLLWKWGYLEQLELNLFKSFLKPGLTVLDLGANLGLYSLTAAAGIGKSGKVIAFEPEQDNFDTLSKSIRRNRIQNIQIYPLAVSDKNEKVYFRRDVFNSGNHQIQKENGKLKEENLSVNAVYLDDLLKNEPVVDIIKMDIQGAEYFALSGMKQLLQKNKDCVIFCEYWPKGLQNNNIAPQDYFQLLKELMLNIYIIDNKHKNLSPANEDDLLKAVSARSGYVNLVLSRNKLTNHTK